MAKDLRKQPRTPMTMTVELTFDDGDTLQVDTKDISDNGVGVTLPKKSPIAWELGMTIIGQVQGLPVEGPMIKLQVVQLNEDRVGFKIIKE